MITDNELSKLNIRRRVGKNCQCTSTFKIVSYVLPIKLDENLISLLSIFGSNELKKTKILKLETQDFIITGLIGSFNIKISIKIEDYSNILINFEKILVKFIKERKTYDRLC